MMNQEIKAEWLRDLRDGTRTQGTGRLRRSDGAQCCLDVLCEQAVRKGVIDPPTLSVGDGFYEYDERYTDDTEWILLPETVKIWAGLDSIDPIVNYNRKNGSNTGSLSSLNDGERCSFGEIATAIENTEL